MNLILSSFGLPPGLPGDKGIMPGNRVSRKRYHRVSGYFFGLNPMPQQPSSPEDVVRDRSALATALGLFIMQWNHVETNLRWLVDAIAGAGLTGEILIARMSTVELCDAALALVREVHGGKCEPEVSHGTLFVDRLREYRNYYAHEVHSALVKSDVGHDAIAFGRAVKKGEMRRRAARVTHPDLLQATEWARSISSYLGDLALQFYNFDDEAKRPPTPAPTELPPKLVLGWGQFLPR